MIAVSPRGENSIVVTPGANAQVTPEFLDSHRDSIRGAGMVLAQLEIPIETVLHLANVCTEYKVPLVLDPAPAHTLPREIFHHMCWFTPNETEAAFFSNQSGQVSQDIEPTQIARRLLGLGVAGVVLKMGSRGVYLASADGSSQMLPIFPVHAVDTTAAGDAFNGAFATALMLGMHSVEAARFASAAAAISVTRAGAQPSMPNRAEVDKLLGAHP
jgi:ribokinase